MECALLGISGSDQAGVGVPTVWRGVGTGQKLRLRDWVRSTEDGDFVCSDRCMGHLANTTCLVIRITRVQYRDEYEAGWLLPKHTHTRVT